MTNKDYERLTVFNEELQRPCMTANFNEDTVDTIAKHTQRLYDLENAIENGTLVFLPCKVGDSFFWIKRSYVGNSPIGEGKVNAFGFRDGKQVIYDGYNLPWELTKIYFTKEAAEKALEELKK